MLPISVWKYLNVHYSNLASSSLHRYLVTHKEKHWTDHQKFLNKASHCKEIIIRLYVNNKEYHEKRQRK